MRCGPGFDDGAAAGVGELFGAVDATCGTSHTLGGLDETLCGTRQIKEIERPGAGGGPGPDPVQLDMPSVVRVPPERHRGTSGDLHRPDDIHIDRVPHAPGGGEGSPGVVGVYGPNSGKGWWKV
jgi:hypothetical protein